MPFHPAALDAATLQKLAKTLKKSLAAPDIQVALPLNQAQEVIARTLGHQDWHAAITQANKAKAEEPLLPNPAVRVFNVPLDDPSLRQAMLDAGVDPDLVATPIFDPFRRAQLFMALYTLTLSRADSDGVFIQVLKSAAGVYRAEGEADMADYLEHVWLKRLSGLSSAHALNWLAETLKAYNPKESFAFRLSSSHGNVKDKDLTRAWAATAEVAREEATRQGDESDYCRLASRPVPPGNVFNFVHKREPAKPRVTALG